MEIDKSRLNELAHKIEATTIKETSLVVALIDDLYLFLSIYNENTAVNKAFKQVEKSLEKFKELRKSWWNQEIFSKEEVVKFKKERAKIFRAVSIIF